MRLGCFLLLLLGLSFEVKSQNVQFSFGDTIYVEPGATFDLAMNIRPFTDGIAFQGIITWDSMCLTYKDTLPGSLMPPVFSGLQSDTLFFAWASAMGATLPDDNAVLKLRFTASQQAPKTTEITFGAPLFYKISGFDIVEQPTSGQKLVVVIRRCSVALDLGPDRRVCTGQTVQVSAACTQCAALKWSDGADSLTRNLSTPGWYSAVATAAQQCISRDSFLLTAASTPAFDLPDTLPLCRNTTATLAAQSPQDNYAYRWSSGEQKAGIEVKNAGIYAVTATNSDGCSRKDSTRVFITGPTAAALTLQQPNCRVLTGRIDVGTPIGGTPPYLYALQNGVLSAGNTFANLAPGAYFLWVQDAAGCEYRDTAEIAAPILPAVSLQADASELALGDSTRLQALLPNGYPPERLVRIIWTPRAALNVPAALSQTAVAKPGGDTWYKVTIVDKDQCSATDSALVRVRVSGDFRIYFPNAIAPEASDPDNAYFTVFSDDTRINQVLRLSIFDRWGTLVYERSQFQPNEIRQGWDGYTASGKILPAGVYLYFAEFELTDGQTLQKEGELTLLR